MANKSIRKKNFILKKVSLLLELNHEPLHYKASAEKLIEIIFHAMILIMRNQFHHIIKETYKR